MGSVLFFLILSSWVSYLSESECQIKTNGYNYIVDTVCDLHGKTLALQPGSVLTIEEEGKIINGVVRGAQNSLIVKKKHSIGVTLIGSWTVPDISDDFFDPNYLSDNSIITSINNLMSDSIQNRVTLSRDYTISIIDESGYGLDVKSNTDVRLNCRIGIMPNDFKHYYIMQIKNRSNIKISGGEIIGDVGYHKYVRDSSSEWGMGCYVYNSSDVTLSDIIVSRCTGDGFYIGGGIESDLDFYSKASRNIRLEGVISDCNRRQGLSITHAQNVIIRNCVFSNTGRIERTAPASGIDIEPNKNQSVRGVSIINCKFENNENYSLVSGATYRVKPGKADTYDIRLINCEVDGTVYICNGGTIVDSCDIHYLKLRDTDMPNGIIKINNSLISQGLYIGNAKIKDRIESDPRIVFSRCKILRSELDAPYPGGLLSISVKDDAKTKVFFDLCELSLPNDLDCLFISGNASIECSYKD